MARVARLARGPGLLVLWLIVGANAGGEEKYDGVNPGQSTSGSYSGTFQEFSDPACATKVGAEYVLEGQYEDSQYQWDTCTANNTGPSYAYTYNSKTYQMFSCDNNNGAGGVITTECTGDSRLCSLCYGSTTSWSMTGTQYQKFINGQCYSWTQGDGLTKYAINTVGSSGYPKCNGAAGPASSLATLLVAALASWVLCSYQ